MSGDIVVSDMQVDDIVLFTEIDDGDYVAECTEDDCDWETDGFQSFVEDAAYKHVEENHK